ncbi:MAG TPA: acylphosphatase [Alphaproteobacteria bacterium]|nr:acylphosphatase [Alphaproteobacteria bacterium]
MTAGQRKCVRLRIVGRVQGVWFRGWTVDQAQELGLDGWVRNRRDGSVEAVASGPAAHVDAFVARCRSGPPAAVVEDVAVMAEAGTVEPGFHQKPTL